MDIINQELEIINNNSIRRRLEREFKKLVEDQIIYPDSVKIDVENDKSGYESYYTVNLINVNDNKYYKFNINLNYPFRPPKIEINFKPYSYYLNIKSNDFKYKLLKHKKLRCLCCSTKLCGENWSPAYTMGKIMDEVESFKNICRDISYFVIVDIIKRKYLIDDIHINEWLF
jgi:ubiquitin-protein ligase